MTRMIDGGINSGGANDDRVRGGAWLLAVVKATHPLLPFACLEFKALLQ